MWLMYLITLFPVSSQQEMLCATKHVDYSNIYIYVKYFKYFLEKVTSGVKVTLLLLFSTYITVLPKFSAFPFTLILSLKNLFQIGSSHTSVFYRLDPLKGELQNLPLFLPPTSFFMGATESGEAKKD